MELRCSSAASVRSDEPLPGYDETIAALSEAGRWELVERGDEFWPVPTSEPELLVRVRAFRLS